MGPFSRVSVAAFLSAVMPLASAVPPIAADDPPPAKPAAPAGAASSSVSKPMIVDNPDGTFTVQRAPAREEKGAARKGLVIPPQVVVPELRPPPSGSSS